MYENIVNRIARDNDESFNAILTLPWSEVWTPFRMVFHAVYSAVILVSGVLAVLDGGSSLYVWLGIVAVILMNLAGEAVAYAKVTDKKLRSAELKYYALWDFKLAAIEMTDDEQLQAERVRDMFNCAFCYAKGDHPWPYFRLWPHAQQEWMRDVFFKALDRHAEFAKPISATPAPAAA